MWIVSDGDGKDMVSVVQRIETGIEKDRSREYRR